MVTTSTTHSTRISVQSTIPNFSAPVVVLAARVTMGLIKQPYSTNIRSHLWDHRRRRRHHHHALAGESIIESQESQETEKSRPESGSERRTTYAGVETSVCLVMDEYLAEKSTFQRAGYCIRLPLFFHSQYTSNSQA